MNLYLLTYEHVLSHINNGWAYFIVADKTAAKAQTRLEEKTDNIDTDDMKFRYAKLLDDSKDSQVTWLSYADHQIDFGSLQ